MPVVLPRAAANYSYVCNTCYGHQEGLHFSLYVHEGKHRSLALFMQSFFSVFLLLFFGLRRAILIIFTSFLSVLRWT